MTYDDMLAAHIRDFDRITARIRAIMLEKNYDNDDSPEMRGLRTDLAQIILRTFALKVCCGRAEDFVAKERNEMDAPL